MDLKRSTRLLRLRGHIERLRGSLWAVPGAAVLTAVVSGTVLTGVEVREGTVIDSIVFGGGADGARQLLTAIATSMVTVTGTVFSITIVVLQLASTAYSPRLLRQFLRDRTTKATLSAFLGTFAYCLAVLRQIRDAQQDPARAEVVPSVAVTGAVVLVLVAVALLVWFVHHITQSIRVETIIRDVTDETRRVIDQVYPHAISEDVEQDELPTPPDSATKVPAPRSGYIQAVDLDILRAWAIKHEVVVRLDDGPGTYLVEGSTIAWVWCLDGEASDLPARELSDLVSDGIHVGYERTMQQDPAFGLRQLVDIAVKAMSTGLNDPTTAVQAIGGMSELLVRLAGRHLPHGYRRDDEGNVRVVLPRRGFGSHLSLAVDQLRRYSASDPSVVRALLELCNDVAAATPSTKRRETVLAAVERIVRAAEREVDDDDLDGVRRAAERVREAAGGRERPDDEGEGDG